MGARLESPALGGLHVEIVVTAPFVGARGLVRGVFVRGITDGDGEEIAFAGGAAGRGGDDEIGDHVAHGVAIGDGLGIDAAVLAAAVGFGEAVAAYVFDGAGSAVRVGDAEDAVGSVEIGVVVAAVGAFVDGVAVAGDELLDVDVVLRGQGRRFCRGAGILMGLQNQQSKQIAAVSGEVTDVKTDVGAAKTDIQKTQTDLATTNQKLEKTIGDLGVQSGLVAHNASELEILKHKGDRNYYDFTLQKNARTPISTVSLQLKKVDAKKSKFTINVIADDKTIEKKDRTVNEPLQFYTGRDHMLYELVVFTADKNSVTGYLSTPKNAPTPVTP